MAGRSSERVEVIMLRAGAKGRHAAIVRELEIPVPFDLGRFVAGLERQRGRPIRLRPFSFGPGCPCGLWIGTADADYIYHEAGTTPSTPPTSPCTRSRTCCSATAHSSLGPAHQPPGARRGPGAHPADPRPQRLQHGRGTRRGNPRLPHPEQHQGTEPAAAIRQTLRSALRNSFLCSTEMPSRNKSMT